MTLASDNSSKEQWLYPFLANSTFLVFFSRIAELIPVLGKIHINLLIFSLTAGCFLLTGVFASTQWRKSQAIRLTLFLLLVGLATVPFAVWSGNAFSGWKERLLINNTIIIFFCFAAMQNEKQMMSMVRTFLMSIIILVIALFLIPQEIQYGRPHVTNSYDANDLSLFFAASFPILFSQFWVRKTKGKVVLSIIVCLIILAILKTGSRGGLLALSVGIVLLLFSQKIKMKIFYKLCVVVIFTAFLFSPQAQNVLERWETVVSGEDYNLTNTVNDGGGRLAIWSSGLVLFRENFFLGVGFGNSSTAMGERYGHAAWRAMHNSYIQVALELGIFGLLTFLLMLRAIWKNCSQVIAETRNRANKNQILIFAVSLKTSLIVYMIGAFFLSQAYSLILPFFLIISDRLHFLAGEEHSESRT